MSGYRVMHWSLCCLAFAISVAGCTSDTKSTGISGSLELSLEVGNAEIDEVHYLITPTSTPMPTPMPTPSPAPPTGNGESGWIDTSAPGTTPSVEVFGLLPGDYTVTLSATSTDGGTTCEGSEDFSIELGKLTEVIVYLPCKLAEVLGGVRVNGEINVCAVLTQSVVKALQTSVGHDFDLSAMGEDAEGDAIAYLWTGTGGSIDDPTSMNTTYTCEEVGDHEVTIEVSDDGSDYCKDSWTTVVTCVGGDGLECIDDEDCDNGEVCNDNNQCVPEVECNENEDCDTGEICLNNECVPDVECNDDQDCDTGFVCENFECVPDVGCNENDDCDLGDICFENVCRADPDLFCDTGLCVEDTELRGECVEKFLLCLADEVDEEECVLLSIVICTECNTGLDCGDDNECTDNVCTAGVCSNPNNDNMCDDGAGTCSAGECVPGGGCTGDGDCASNEVCDAGECVVGDCTGDGDCDDADDCTSDNCVANNCVYAPAPVGTVCGNDGQCTSDGSCTEGSCTSTADSTYVCSPAGAGIKGALTQCGVCEALGFGCPNDCSGDPIAGGTPAATCAANTILLGGDGGACTSGLSVDCLGCYNGASSCGTGNCTSSCSNLAPGAINGPNGCDCIDCVITTCDTAFTACAGFSQGSPAGTPNPHPTAIGGPPICEDIPLPACAN